MASSKREQELELVLELILDSCDYTNAACRPNELIASVFQLELLRRAKEVMKMKVGRDERG